MKRCLRCDTRYVSSIRDCPECGFGPTPVDGFDSYAPDLAHGGGGFKPNYFSELAQLEGTNFWFRSRNQLILWALKEYCPNMASFLEVGCGTGFVLSAVSETFPSATLHGSEIFTAGLGVAATRLPHVKFIQIDARRIPFSEEFDVIGAFDVLEHVMEDEEVLRNICESLKANGILLLSIPQHQWLWSSADEYACHIRRYEADDLHRKIERSGFSILRSTSFVTFLLPAMIISRMFRKGQSKQDIDPAAEFKISSRINLFFYRVLCWELALLRKGVDFPAGGSRLVVARKL